MQDRAFTPTRTPLVAIVVTYDSADVIAECLTSLLDQSVPDMRIILVDNASGDQTVAAITRLAQRRGVDFGIEGEGDTTSNQPLPKVLLIRARENRGFAAGCNLGLKAAKLRSDAPIFWLLNPDCQAEPRCASAYLRKAADHPGFGLMGGRTLFSALGQKIQSDGGQISRWTAVCKNVNQGLPANLAPRPDVRTLNFVSGANLVASREFLETVGPMPEDYFLYYEEVAWALRRNTLPLIVCPEAKVRHHGGTSAGSATLGRAPSAFANYFNYRNRVRLAARYSPSALPGAYIYSMLKIVQLALKGAFKEAWGAFLGLHQLRPTKEIQRRLGSAAMRFAIAR